MNITKVLAEEVANKMVEPLERKSTCCMMNRSGLRKR